MKKAAKLFAFITLFAVFSTSVLADTINTFDSGNASENINFLGSGFDSSVGITFNQAPYSISSSVFSVLKELDAGQPNNNISFQSTIDLGESAVEIFNPFLTPTHYIAANSDSTQDSRYVDFDLDGDMDFVVANKGAVNHWYERTAASTYVEHEIHSDDLDSYTLDVEDFDMDGDVDVLIGNASGVADIWYENDGSMSFTPHTIGTSTRQSYRVEIVDLDLDGDKDYVEWSYFSPNYWWRNDGSMNFTGFVYQPISVNSSQGEVVDIDGDGDLDIIEPTYTGVDYWHENDGSMNFIAHSLWPTVGDSRHILPYDIDTDGDLDFLVVRSLGSSYWLENDGSMNLTEHTLARTGQIGDVQDIDQDGDLDILIFLDNSISVFDNDGSLNFSEYLLTNDSGSTYEAGYAIDDVDEDGDYDFLAARRGSRNYWVETLLGYYDEALTDFASDLFDYVIENCAVYPCTVPLKVSSNNAGRLNLYGLDIDYSPNAPSEGDYDQISYIGLGDNSRVIRDLIVYDGDVYAVVDGDRAQLWSYGGSDFRDWSQVDSDGFGDTGNWYFTANEVYGGELYLGSDHSSGTEVWSYDGAVLTQVNVNGFGDANNNYVYDFVEYGGNLIAGTYNSSTGTEVWEYDGSTWTQINVDGFADANNEYVDRFFEYNGNLYAFTENWATGVEVWEYDGLVWTQINTDAFGDINNEDKYRVLEYGGNMIVSILNSTTGTEVWSYDGGSWTQINSDGFGDSSNSFCDSMLTYGADLYCLSSNSSGAEIWEYDGLVWSQNGVNGFGNVQNTYISDAFVYDGNLYAFSYGMSCFFVPETGFTCVSTGARLMEYDGSAWAQVNSDGFGDIENSLGENSLIDAADLYFSTQVGGSFAVWQKQGILGADLALSIVVDDDTVNEGDNVEFTITVTNNGPVDATNIVISDLLPAGFTYVSDIPSQGSYDEITGDWTLGGILNAGNASLVINATMDNGTAGTSISNIASVSSFDQTDSFPANDSSSVTVNVYDEVDLALLKTVDNAAPSPGDNVVYTLTLENTGIENATSVQVTDLLPAGLTYVSSVISQGSYDEITGIWDVGVVLTLASATLDITAQVNAGSTGVISNIAEVTQVDQLDVDSTPNNADILEDDYASQDIAINVPSSGGGGGGGVSHITTIRNYELQEEYEDEQEEDDEPLLFETPEDYQLTDYVYQVEEDVVDEPEEEFVPYTPYVPVYYYDYSEEEEGVEEADQEDEDEMDDDLQQGENQELREDFYEAIDSYEPRDFVDGDEDFENLRDLDSDDDGDGFSFAEELFFGTDPDSFTNPPTSPNFANIDSLEIGPFPSFRFFGPEGENYDVLIYNKDTGRSFEFSGLEIGDRYKGEFGFDESLPEGEYYGFIYNEAGIYDTANFVVKENLDEEAPLIALYASYEGKDVLISDPVKSQKSLGEIVKRVISMWENTTQEDYLVKIYRGLYDKNIVYDDIEFVVKIKTQRPSEQVYIAYKSVILSSAVLSDASQGEVVVKIPRDLYDGEEHEAIVYTYNPILRTVSSASRIKIRR